ncbi:hypothetical protein MO867_00075 [Microbulbifer sp. OS29]|uniref:Uncharacterized protein n=1 Tax=Microbulbifer okhotskensis TaxID=2926617 RepID=A0A9X2EKJ8_9GAMM|nr:hypothetical protein [Microbulbifer okhotskensis]MCO1332720.1 hypothetical protein [Microbulbifer okhotskensis]
MSYCKVCIQEQKIYEDVGHRCVLCRGWEPPKIKKKPSFLQFPMPDMNRKHIFIRCKWDLFVIVLTISLVALIVISYFKVVISQRVESLSEGAILADLTSEGYIFSTLPVIFVSIILFATLSKLISYLIPTARKELDKELNLRYLGGYGLRQSIRNNFRILLCFLAFFVPMMGLGLNSYYVVSSSGLKFNSLFSLFPKEYNWSQIQAVETTTGTGAARNRWIPKYIFRMDDNNKINLIDDKLQKFIASYPRLRIYLRDQNHIKYEQSLTDDGVRWLRNHLSKSDFGEVMYILQDTP